MSICLLLRFMDGFVPFSHRMYYVYQHLSDLSPSHLCSFMIKSHLTSYILFIKSSRIPFKISKWNRQNLRFSLHLNLRWLKSYSFIKHQSSWLYRVISHMDNNSLKMQKKFPSPLTLKANTKTQRRMLIFVSKQKAGQ